jgi:hypothetical protein
LASRLDDKYRGWFRRMGTEAPQRINAVIAACEGSQS